MTRSEQREHAFLMLFRTCFHEEEDLVEQNDLYLDEIERELVEERMPLIKETETQFIIHEVENTRHHLAEIDQAIEEKAKGWKIDRIGRVELTILRLAIYEILFEDSIPAGVSINEAVELAKKYGQDESGSFINGILATFAK